MARTMNSLRKDDSVFLGKGDSCLPGEIVLVGYGKRAYLTARPKDGATLCSFSGEKFLRALANAILKEVGK